MRIVIQRVSSASVSINARQHSAIGHGLLILVGICDQDTKARLKECGTEIKDVLADNDAYHALGKCDGLIMTGATGTNVNDLTVLLIKR